MAKPGLGLRFPDSVPFSSVLQVFLPVGGAAGYLISYSLRCNTCQSSLLWWRWWVLFSSAIPCGSSVTPINFNTQDSPAGQVSPRATLRQVPRFPSDTLSSTSAWPPDLPLSSLLTLNRSLKMLENISQLRNTRSFCSTLSWAQARTLTSLAWSSPWRLHPQCPQTVSTVGKRKVL